MNKQFILFTLISAFFVSVFTAILHQTGLGSPYLTFPVLSLLVPVILQRMRQGQFSDLPLCMRYHTYSWAIFTVINLFTTPFNVMIDNEALIILVFLGVYFFTQVLLELVALLMTFFFNRNHRWGIVDEAIDMSVYILPIPFIYLGSIFYIDLTNPVMLAYFGPTISLNSLIGEFVFVLVSMLVFVFYMYPRSGEYKASRLLRIIVTAIMLLAMNGHILYGGYIPKFVKAIAPTIFPLYQGNLLVFITPGLLEFTFIIASVLIGKLVEVGIIKTIAKRKG
jgi:putative membrane protein